MNILTFTTLYPNAAQPAHGVFVAERLRHLRAHADFGSQVIAPVPWVPPGLRGAARYRDFVAVPKHEQRDQLAVHHPRYPVVPRFGMMVAPALLAAWSLRPLRTVIDKGFDFDLIDAHYFYPDGVAASMLGAWLRKPVVITARGSDVNVIGRYPAPRAMMRRAASRSAAVISVSDALRDALIEIGVDEERITTLRNGVDLHGFKPLERDAVRRRLGLAGLVLLSVGKLDGAKGQDLAIQALADFPDATLVIAGEGAARARLQRLAERCGVSHQVRFTGMVAHEELVSFYNAADLLLLLSKREGMPNVVLEALACGTRVVATAVGGIPEVVQHPDAGQLVTERTPECVAATIKSVLQTPVPQSATRKYAEGFAWGPTVAGQMELYRRCAAAPSMAAPATRASPGRAGYRRFRQR